MNNEHYRELVQKKTRTKLASCGYADRFDPFVLNKDPRLRILYDGLFSLLPKDVPCGKLLDIGCGTGIYFDALAGHSQHIEAIDFSDEMIRIAREYCSQNNLNNINARKGSAEMLEYEDESFDVVIELDALHHICDLEKTLAEVSRVLKPGGHFLVFEPNVSNPLIFLVHALPAEERLAVSRNRPGKLVKLLEKRFDTVRWDGVCSLITQPEGIKGFILDTYLKFWKVSGLKQFYPRQVWLGRK